MMISKGHYYKLISSHVGYSSWVIRIMMGTLVCFPACSESKSNQQATSYSQSPPSINEASNQNHSMIPSVNFLDHSPKVRLNVRKPNSPVSNLFEGEGVSLPQLPENEHTPLEVADSTSETLEEVDLAPIPWDPNAFVRPRKRMDVDQLSQAFVQFTGGPGWQTNWQTNQGQQDGWKARWATLGGPDFITRVTEDLRPNTLFHKVIRDAAVEVCLPLVNHEMPTSGDLPETRHLVLIHDPYTPLTDQLELREALRSLLLHAHGIDLNLDDPELNQWVSLMLTVRDNSTDLAEPWRALCIALIIHPRFWSY